MDSLWGLNAATAMSIEVDHRVMFVDFDQRAGPVSRLHHAVAFGPRFHDFPMLDGSREPGTESALPTGLASSTTAAAAVPAVPAAAT